MMRKEKHFYKWKRRCCSSIALSLAAACGLTACSPTQSAMKELSETEAESELSAESESTSAATPEAEVEEIDFSHLEATLKLMQLQYSEDFTFALNLPLHTFPDLSETETVTESSEPALEETDHTGSGSAIGTVSEKTNDNSFKAENDTTSKIYTDTESGKLTDTEAETELLLPSHIIIPENFAYEFPLTPGTFKLSPELRQFPLPALPLSIAVLESRINDLIKTYSGQWSVYVKNLTTQEELLIGDQPMKSASVMKLFIMGTVYDAIQKGELERTEEVVNLLNNMISYSSNDDSNHLLFLLGDGSYEKGIEKVNDYISSHRYEGETHEYNGFNDEDTLFDEDHFNQVSAKDCGKLLERIYHRTFGSRKICNEIETMMLNQNTRYKIPAGLPEGIPVGNKTGEMDTVENDVAIIYGDKSDYILCVLSSDWEDKKEAISHIAEISSTVYEFFNDDSYYLEVPDMTAYDYEFVEPETEIFPDADQKKTEAEMLFETDSEESETEMLFETDSEESETKMLFETDTEEQEAERGIKS